MSYLVYARGTQNMKKHVLAEIAIKLYTEKFMTLESIAKQLNVNERTLRRWKSVDNWENKRLEYIKSKLHSMKIYTISAEPF